MVKYNSFLDIENIDIDTYQSILKMAKKNVCKRANLNLVYC